MSTLLHLRVGWAGIRGDRVVRSAADGVGLDGPRIGVMRGSRLSCSIQSSNERVVGGIFGDLITR